MGLHARYFIVWKIFFSTGVRRLLIAAVVCIAFAPPPAAGQSPAPSRTAGQGGTQPQPAGQIPKPPLDLRQLSRRYLARSVAMRDEALREADRMGWPVRGVTADGTVFELQRIAGGMPLYYITLNARAATSTRTDLVQQRIGGGAGITIGIWDAGFVRHTHRELAGRVMLAEGVTSGLWSDHATEVAGMLAAAGIRPEAKGMSYEARLISHSWSHDLAEVALDAADGLLLTNHSYGHARGWYREYGGQVVWGGDVAISKHEDYHFGLYDEDARDWDELARAAPFCLIVAGAGNDRNDRYPPGTEHRYFDGRTRRWETGTDERDPDGGVSGYDCLPDGKPVSKNLLVVGAARNLYSYYGIPDVEMTIFSSWGPTDDGRIKPDIVGVGDIVYTCSVGSDSAYSTVSGTSFSSPNVCGALALLQDYYQDRHGGRPMRAATLKALALHTTREAGDHPGPDYTFGWGLLDSYAAYELITADLDGRTRLIDELTLDEGRPLTLRYACDGTAPELKVTICWHDPPGTPPAPALDPPDIMLVNDLDCRVSTRDAVYRPWVLDPAHPWRAATRGDNRCDNVEQVRISNPAAGVYTVTIGHKGTLADGSQDVSLIVSGGVRAGVWYVSPDGSGDFYDITSAVEAAADGDHILVAPGIYHEQNILVDKSLTLTSTGGSDTTLIDAASEGRCLVIEKTGGPVLVEGLSLVNGAAYGEEREGCGGAVLCGNAEAVIRNCRIARSGARFGGGIAVAFAAPVIEDCIITDNEAMENGGGVYCFDANPVLERCFIVQNIARIDGGGVFCRFASPRIDRCTVSHNDASAHGGGIYAGYESGPEVTASIVSFSERGGGIYCYPSMSDVTLRCCNVYGNTGGDYGGAIFDQTGRDGNISRDPLFCDPGEMQFGIGNTSPCRPERNDCGVLVGAAGIRCLTSTVCRVEPEGTGDMPTIQAAIDAVADGDTVLLAPGTYRGPGNRDISFRGKSIIVRSDPHYTEPVIDCTDISGTAHCGFEFSSGEDTSSVLERVYVMWAAGGGILCRNGSSPTIRLCFIHECGPAGQAPGGGIHIEDSSPRIIGTSLYNNFTNGNGGGIRCINSSPELSDCSFYSNAAAGNGGGIYIAGGSTVSIQWGRFFENSAEDGAGGGIYCESSAVELSDIEIWSNRSLRGGGVYCGPDVSFSAVRASISGNQAADTGGGIECVSSASIENCTITYNSAGEHGAGIACADGETVGITQTIAAFNQVSEGICTERGDIDAACCDVYGNEGGDYGGGTADLTGTGDNISADPDFCDYEGGIYDTSPCAAANSPCGGLIGALDVSCSTLPDLIISKMIISDTSPRAGEAINIYVEVKNIGRARADTFFVDLYYDDPYRQFLGLQGDERCLVADGLAVGDSALCAFMGITSDTAAAWEMIAFVDVDMKVDEPNTYNNRSGLHRIFWQSDDIIPAETRLRAIFPNPSSGETAVRFDLHRGSRVTIAIYDVAGRRVATLYENAPMPAGRVEIVWDGRTDGGHAAATGVYFCRFTAGAVDDVRKLLLIR